MKLRNLFFSHIPMRAAQPPPIKQKHIHLEEGEGKGVVGIGRPGKGGGRRREDGGEEG